MRQIEEGKFVKMTPARRRREGGEFVAREAQLFEVGECRNRIRVERQSANRVARKSETLKSRQSENRRRESRKGIFAESEGGELRELSKRLGERRKLIAREKKRA